MQKNDRSKPGAPAEMGAAAQSKKSGGITLPSMLSSLIMRILDGEEEEVPVTKAKPKEIGIDKRNVPSSGLSKINLFFKDRFSKK